MARFGNTSWELDALPPDVLRGLIDEHVALEVDMDRLEARRESQEHDRELLTSVSSRWADVASFVGGAS